VATQELSPYTTTLDKIEIMDVNTTTPMLDVKNISGIIFEFLQRYFKTRLLFLWLGSVKEKKDFAGMYVWYMWSSDALIIFYNQ